MESEELKRKLMGLWEKTSHNSKDLLGALFDYYFDINYLQYKEVDGKIVSALCGIPYSFGFGGCRLKGLYIISLSAEEGYKRKGDLSELLESLNVRLKDEFDFTFLVPHTELLADYYGSKGYFSSFFMLEERFTPEHDFRKDYLLSLYDSEERIRKLKTKLIDEIKVVDNKVENLFSKESIVKFITDIEKQGKSSINLCHSEKDMEYLLSNDTIRNLKLHVAYDSDEKITGIIFSEKEEIKRLRVVAAYTNDNCSYFALLDNIKKQYDDYSISINTYDPKYQTHSLTHLVYASSNPAGGDLDNTISYVELPFNYNKLLQPMGMVRILRFENIINYIARTRSDISFKLYIKDNDSSVSADVKEPENGIKLVDDQSVKDQIDFIEETNIEEVTKNNNLESSEVVFVVNNGKCHKEPYSKLKKDSSILKLTTKEVSELLLRKNDSSNLIMEAFGIPRLDLQMLLLPC